MIATCLCCPKNLEVTFGVEKGTAFRGAPGFGSTLDFNEEPGVSLMLFLCDDCLKKASDRIVRVTTTPQPPLVDTSEWNPE